MDVRERAKLAEDERILSMTDGSHSEGRNPEALEADKARYKDSTYEIVSKVAYLIGVPKRIFENEYEPPKMEVYERLEQDKAARIIRHLCMIRTAIERNFKHINEKMRFDYTSIYNLFRKIAWLNSLPTGSILSKRAAKNFAIMSLKSIS